MQHVEPREDVSGVYLCTTWGQEPGRRYDRMIDSLLIHAASTGLRMCYKDINGKHGVADGHNKLIERFLQTDYEWILHLDADCLITPAHMERLASWRVPAVTALTFRRKPPYTPTLYQVQEREGWLQDFDWVRDWLYQHLEDTAVMDEPPLITQPKSFPLVTVKRCGSHCLLVHRNVIEDIAPPWFEALHRSGSGSDFYFCEQIQEAGYEVYADLSVMAGHLCGDYCTGPLDWMVWDKWCEYDSEGERLEVRLVYDDDVSDAA